MDDVISYDDLVQLYSETLCLYKGDPVKIMSCNKDFTVKLHYLEAGKKAIVKFSMDTFSAPLHRIGFVNHANTVFYVKRNPRRQWAVGLKSNNTAVTFPAFVAHQPGAVATLESLREVAKMELKTVGLAVKNIYPSFPEALRMAEEHQGCYAFDRQFAVDCERNIYYKLECIGSIPKNKNKLEAVVFKEGFDYLQIPLLQHYEKTFRTFAA